MVVVVVVLILNSVKLDVSFWKRKSRVSSASLFLSVSSGIVMLTTEAGSPQLWMIKALAALRQTSIRQKQKWSGWYLRSSWKWGKSFQSNPRHSPSSPTVGLWSPGSQGMTLTWHQVELRNQVKPKSPQTKDVSTLLTGVWTQEPGFGALIQTWGKELQKESSFRADWSARLTSGQVWSSRERLCVVEVT